MLRIFKNTKSLRRIGDMRLRNQIQFGQSNALRTFRTHLNASMITSAFAATSLILFNSPKFCYFGWFGSGNTKQEIPKEMLVFRNHPDYPRLIAELKQAVGNTSGKDLNRIQLTLICRLVVLIGADDLISRFHDYSERRRKFFKEDDSDNHMELLIDMLNIVREKCDNYTKVVLAELGISLQDWKHAVRKNEGFKHREINPRLELYALFQLSQKSQNVNSEQLELIYSTIIHVIESFKETNMVKQIKVFKKCHPDYTEEETLEYFTDFIKLILEDTLNSMLGTLPGDGLYSGLNFTPKVLELSKQADKKYEELIEIAKKNLS